MTSLQRHYDHYDHYGWDWEHYSKVALFQGWFFFRYWSTYAIQEFMDLAVAWVVWSPYSNGLVSQNSDQLFCEPYLDDLCCSKRSTCCYVFLLFRFRFFDGGRIWWAKWLQAATVFFSCMVATPLHGVCMVWWLQYCHTTSWETKWCFGSAKWPPHLRLCVSRFIQWSPTGVVFFFVHHGGFLK